MAQQVQELINKIKSEGVEAAQEKAREIEAQARKKAQEIVQAAQIQADQITAQAKDEIKKSEAASRMALQQASRNTILNLHKEIENLLQRIILKEVRDSLSAEQVSELIHTTIKTFLTKASDKASVEVSLNPQEAAKVKDGFLAKLQAQVKKSLHIKASDEIGKGFVISFDGGKSCFDFSDESLAEYLGAYLNRELAALLKDSVTRKG